MKYKTIDQKTIFKEKFLKINRVDLEIDTYDGRKLKIERYALIRPEVGALLLYDPVSDEIVLVEQFRYSSLKTEKGWVKEIVAGLIEPRENPIECVKREALEEAGYKVDQIKHFNSFYPSWGFSDNIVHLYYGEISSDCQVNLGGGLKEEDEDIKVIRQKLDDALEEIEAGKIKDSKTIIALQWLALKRANQKNRPINP